MERFDLKSKILFIIAGVLACFLVGILIIYQINDYKDDSYIESIKEKAKPYEQELREIENDLEDMREAIAVKNEVALVTVGFQIESIEDFVLVQKLTEQFEFQPVIVLNVNHDEIENIIKEVSKTNYSVVLTCSPINEDIKTDIKRVRKKLSDSSKKVYNSNLFLLRNIDDTDENLKSVKDMGFVGCLRHPDSSDIGVLENGLICLNYSQIKSDAFSINTRLSSVVKDQQSLVIIFDFSNKSLSENAVTYYLGCINQFIADGKLEYSDIEHLKRTVELNAELQKLNQMTYDEYAAVQQEKIDKLQKKIDGIYSHWNGE